MDFYTKDDESGKSVEIEDSESTTDEVGKEPLGILDTAKSIVKAIPGFIKSIPDFFRRLFKRDGNDTDSYGKSVESEYSWEESDEDTDEPFDIIKAIKRFIRAIPGFIRSIPGYCRELFEAVRDGADTLGTQTNAFSVISIIVLAVAFLLNLTNISTFINTLSTAAIGLLAEGLGLNLSDLVSDWMDSNNFSSLFSLLLWIFQIAVFLLSLVLDILLNILGIVLLILLFILHIIISFVYAILLPAGMVALGVFGLIEDKSVTNIAIIILDVCLAVLFYIVLIV